MNRTAIEKQLIIDEGKRLTVYKDTLGNDTVGIGHLIVPEDYIPPMSVISEERCQALFESDLNMAIIDVQKLFSNLDQLPDAIQDAIVNMVFNMGIKKMRRFCKFLAAVDSKDFEEAGMQLVNSLWFKQVGLRAERIAKVFFDAADVEWI